MTNEDAVVTVIDALIALEIPFMMVGSFAYNQYGIPRSTQDADMVIELGDQSIGELSRLLKPKIHLDPQMTFETVTLTRRFKLSVMDRLFEIELFLLSNDPHDQARFQRRRFANALNRSIPFLTPEDVVVTKLRWSRPKDLDDVRNLIAVQGDDALDWSYIHSWCEQHGTRETLDQIRASIPPI